MALSMNDYRKQVERDAYDYLEENVDYLDCVDMDDMTIDADDFLDDLWTADSVTGNVSGSYTFNARKAMQNVSELIWDDDFIDELGAFGYDLGDIMKEGPEAVDVTIRCMVSGEAGYKALKRFAKKNGFKVI